MNFKRGRSASSIPEINLVPMMDVLMTVLTFFIIISMTLTLERGVEVDLPGSANQPTPAEQPLPLIVGLTEQGQILLNQQPLSKDVLASQVTAYLEANPTGFVVLNASPNMPYEQVIQLLTEMKALGGDRVSLAIE